MKNLFLFHQLDYALMFVQFYENWAWLNFWDGNGKIMEMLVNFKNGIY